MLSETMLHASSPIKLLTLPTRHPPVSSWLPRPIPTAKSASQNHYAYPHTYRRNPLSHTAPLRRPFAFRHDYVSKPCPKRSLIPSASSVSQATVWDMEGDVADSWPSNPVDVDDGEPLASESTLVMLDWPRVCESVAGFASTATGKQVARNLEMPTNQRRSETLLAETHAALAIESRQSGALVFSGINTQLVPILCT